VALLTRKRLSAVSLGVGAWGTVAVLWMGSSISKVGSYFNSPEIQENPFAALFASQISPGAGLYLGLIGGLATAASLGYVAVHRLRPESRLWLVFTVQGGAITTGLLISFGLDVGPSSQSTNGEAGQGLFAARSSNSGEDEAVNPLCSGTHVEGDAKNPHEKSSRAGTAAERAYAPKVILRNISVAKSTLDEQGVFGEIKNTGDRTLSEVQITVYCLDEDGRRVSEEVFHPVRKDTFSFSTRDYMPLRPNYTEVFGYALSETSDWSGRVNVEITGLKFAEQSSPSNLVEANQEKQEYLPNIELRDVHVGESVLGEPGVFGELKNTGPRTLMEVEIIIYGLDDTGRRVFETRYHPLLVSDSSWSTDPDSPLKPNYTESFGCKIQEAPSDWSGRIEVVVHDIRFAG
ncbi:MAG: FxLYD domain-containing protein, partial [Pirellulaceae bacterium]